MAPSESTKSADRVRLFDSIELWRYLVHYWNHAITILAGVWSLFVTKTSEKTPENPGFRLSDRNLLFQGGVGRGTGIGE
jgi:hypothetical protein